MRFEDGRGEGLSSRKERYKSIPSWKRDGSLWRGDYERVVSCLWVGADGRFSSCTDLPQRLYYILCYNTSTYGMYRRFTYGEISQPPFINFDKRRESKSRDAQKGE